MVEFFDKFLDKDILNIGDKVTLKEGDINQNGEVIKYQGYVTDRNMAFGTEGSFYVYRIDNPNYKGYFTINEVEYWITEEILNELGSETKSIDIEVPNGYEIDEEASTFEHVVFKKKHRYSKGWKEYCTNNPSLKRGPEKFAGAMIALGELLTVREYEYTKGWEPDWEDKNKTKYIIFVSGNKITSAATPTANSVLSFPTKELCETFLSNWESLLEIAKPLL